MKTQDLDQFTRAYIECALWSSPDESDTPLDASYDSSDIAPEAIERMRADCAKFQAENGTPDYNDPRHSDAEKAGHDFWLTRNGHGAGFWSRDELSEVDQKRLTDAAHAFGTCNLYVGDDGQLWLA